MKLSRIQQIIKEEVAKVLNEEISTGTGLEISQTKKFTKRMGDGDANVMMYDVKLNGKSIGKLKYESYFGGIEGNLYGKELPDFGTWEPVGVDNDKMFDEEGDETPEFIKGKLIGFLNSQTGKKWLETLKK